MYALTDFGTVPRVFVFASPAVTFPIIICGLATHHTAKCKALECDRLFALFLGCTYTNTFLFVAIVPICALAIEAAVLDELVFASRARAGCGFAAHHTKSGECVRRHSTHKER
jgi:hypothetical protein